MRGSREEQLGRVRRAKRATAPGACAAVGLAVMLSCRGEKPLTPSDVLGCYDLAVADWNPERAGGMDSLRLLTFLPPPRVEFLSEPFDVVEDVPRFMVRPAPGSRASPHWLAVWHVEGDSIQAVWWTGFEGVMVTLGRERGSFRGHASPYTDADRLPRPVSAAVATPVPCNEVPAYPLRASQLVARTVPLEAGKRLVIGEPLPDGVRATTQPGTRDLLIEGRATGPFSGADSVYVMPSREGLIRGVRFAFPAAIDSDSLMEVLEEALVRPEWRSAVVGTRRWAWEDWTTRVWVSRWKAGVTVTLSDPRLR